MNKCKVTNVASTKVALISFEHGDLIPEQAHKLKCKLYEHKHSGKRLLTVETGEGEIFSGREQPEQNLSQTLIAIRNKKTNKVRLVPTEGFFLSRVYEKQTSTVSEATLEDKQRLGLKFGSKRVQRSLEQLSNSHLDEEMKDKRVSQAVDGVSVSESDLTAAAVVVVNEYLPPINRNASTVEEVYKLHDFISSEELDTLRNVVIQFKKKPEDCPKNTFTGFFWDLLPKVINDEELDKFCALVYADAVIQFLRKTAKDVQNKNYVACLDSHVVSLKILNLFTLESTRGRLRPNTMRDKAVSHVIVLGLIISQFSLRLKSLSTSLKIPIKRLQQFSYAVGATAGSVGSDTVLLKLPLPVPSIKKNFKSRR